MPLSRRRGASCTALVMATAGACLLAACGSATKAPPDRAAAATNAPLHSLMRNAAAGKTTLDVASNIEYPPFESYAADNTTVQGVDRELADEFEKLLGVKLVFHNTAFDAIIPGLAAERYDLAMSAMSDTVERQKQVDFVDYLKAGGGIMLPKDNPHKVAALDDLCGLKVAIDKGTTEVQDGQDQIKKCRANGRPAPEISIFPGQNQMVLALQSGRADAALIDSTAGGYVAGQTGAFTMLPPYESGSFGIVFRKGDTALEQAFAKALERLARDGTYQKILAKYGQETGTLDSFPINGVTS
ncbi:ABC transporter substrate-binding protein [Streptomyces sp. NPDC001276]|uniref:ABC transporter substrate-binding protein n=1 Tax=Streptomyces sp. NPDC001276 TaxID=3364555 RepID=UPI00367398DA